MSKVQIVEGGSRLSVITQPVTVVHGTDSIGRGDLVMTETRIDVTGSYQWPPDAPAEVRFLFGFEILTDSTCNLTMDWPGLLPAPIPQTECGYTELLLEARPQFLIFVPDGSLVTATFLGPFGFPGIVTAFTVGITGPEGKYSQGLNFRYEHGQS